MSTPQAYPRHDTGYISWRAALCMMEGERCECDSLFFAPRWWRPAVLRARSGKGRMSPLRVHRSLGALAISLPPAFGLRAAV